jgi:hypothetical protein
MYLLGCHKLNFFLLEQRIVHSSSLPYITLQDNQSLNLVIAICIASLHGVSKSLS